MPNDPVAVYVDQNVLSTLANTEGPWQETDLGKLLDSPEVETWVSPVHCFEIAQATDNAQRARLARTALELAAFKRIWPTYESIVTRAFAQWLDAAAPQAVRNWDYIHHGEEFSQRTMLSMLALMALERPVSDESLTEILAGKFVTQRLHAEAVGDPVAWIRGLVDSASDLTLVTESEDVLDQASVEEMRTSINEIAIGAGIPAKLRDTLNKRRRSIARAYGAIEAGKSIVAALSLPVAIEYTFDADKIKAAWNELHTAAGTRTVPQPDTTDGATALLTQLKHALARGKGLLPATVANETIIREVERFAAQQKRPNAGVVFDGDHAAYLIHAQVFISDDEALRSSLKPLADLVSEETNPPWKAEVVTSGQAISTLRRLTR